MTDTRLADDLVLPFQLESCALRGRLVRLGAALDTILNRHAYPEKVGQLLGETTALAAALALALKFEGVFTLQAKSDGAVKLLVSDVTSDGGIRSYAQLDEAKLSDEAAKLLGEGHLAFTVDRRNKDERYQGLVALEGDNLAEAVQHYFRQSEQIPTGLIAHATKDADGHWRGGCLMIQRMPRDGGKEVAIDTAVEEDWQRVMCLMQTCTMHELTDVALPAEDLLFRLFHEESVRVYDAQPLRHECRCSEERVTNMIKSLPQDEVEQLAVNGLVSVTCEFCNRTYSFDAEKRAALFQTSLSQKTE